MADMQYAVVFPYRMVLTSIIRRSAPKIANDPAYPGATIRRCAPHPPAAGAAQLLGLVKFIFPNPHHVYLHDTPSKALFGRARRDFSHGCIRVANPPALAEFVLSETPGWDRARIDKAMQSGPDNRHVPLAVPIPVYVLWQRQFGFATGVHFFDDIYYT
jgi:murein L,D-transpeptidase YcbB/YkuD